MPTPLLNPLVLILFIATVYGDWSTVCIGARNWSAGFPVAVLPSLNGKWVITQQLSPSYPRPVYSLYGGSTDPRTWPDQTLLNLNLTIPTGWILMGNGWGGSAWFAVSTENPVWPGPGAYTGLVYLFGGDGKLPSAWQPGTKNVLTANGAGAFSALTLNSPSITGEYLYAGNIGTYTQGLYSQAYGNGNASDVASWSSTPYGYVTCCSSSGRDQTTFVFRSVSLSSDFLVSVNAWPPNSFALWRGSQNVVASWVYSYSGTASSSAFSVSFNGDKKTVFLAYVFLPLSSTWGSVHFSTFLRQYLPFGCLSSRTAPMYAPFHLTVPRY